MNLNKKACGCKDVTYGMIADAVRRGARTYEDVARMTGCGTGCGRCREFIECLVRELTEEMK